MGDANKAFYEAYLTAEQVKAELKSIEYQTDQAVGGYGKFDKATKNLEGSSKQLGMYLADTSKVVGDVKYKMNAADVGTGGLNDAMKKIRPTLAASAASISLVANALGDQAGKSGQLINLGGQMLAAYGAGGPYGLAFAAGIAGVSALESHYDSLIKKQDEALNRQYKATDEAAKSLNKVEDELEGIRIESLNSSAAAYARVGLEIKQVKDKQDLLRKGLLDENEIRHKQELLTENGLNANAVVSEQTLNENENKKQAIKLYDQIIEKLEKKQALEAAKAAPGQGGDVAAAQNAIIKANADIRARAEFDAAAWLQEQLDELNDKRGIRRAQDEQDLIESSNAMYEAMLDGQREAAANSDLIWERSIKKRQADDAKFEAAAADSAHRAVGLAESTASDLTNTFSGYLDMKIEGEKNAELKTTAAFMKGVGNKLVGIGLESEFSGAAKLFDPVTAPIGVLEMGFGAAAIGAGLALGAGGTAVGHIAAGGTIGTPIDKKSGGGIAGGGRGSSRSSGGGGGGGGNTTIVNVYNGALVAPAPQDQGRGVQNVLQARARAAGTNTSGVQQPARGP